MKIQEILSSLRKSMEASGIDAYLITGTDPHQSEYVAPRWRTRAFVSGFSGSAGTVLVSRSEALLWVDSRYYIQGAKEIEGSEYKLMKLGEENVQDVNAYILSHFAKGSVIGVDGSSISISRMTDLSKAFKAKGISLVATEDLLDPIWTDRPDVPFSSLVEVPVAYAGKTRDEKLALIRQSLTQKGASCTFIAAVDDIAWILNLRGNDIAYNPVFMAYLFIDGKKAVLFTDENRFDEKLKEEVLKDVQILPYDAALSYLPALLKGKVYYDCDRINVTFLKALSSKKAITGRDISTDMKACKNYSELAGMRKSHLMDGVAFANFMAKLDSGKVYDEIAISDAFEDERKKMPGYLGPSFGPISGFGPHGAMCHYSATKESSALIDKQGLLVLDTGSQFEYGMTDLTRTLLFGTPSEEQMRDYTLVLKGHLALSSQRFIAGTCGYQLDVLAKMFMWQAGMSFYHGTGHGVGCRLNVHEGPENISPKPIAVPLQPGMVISDEPGIYKEGRHGIRIENLVTVSKDIKTEFGQFYTFEVLTVVPYEKRLIDLRYLSDVEINLINAYHTWVHDELISLVDEGAKAWLEEATSPITRK